MKKWIVMSLTVVSLSFIALNGYLITKKDSKVQHTVYVDNWTRVKKDDVVQTFETEGIIMPQEEYDVYFHDRDKEFQRFLVKEGDEVTAGTPLFEYTTPELDKLRETLELERQETEGEIAGIDVYISKLLDYQSSLSSTPSYFEPDFTFEEDLSINEDTSSDVIIGTIEQEIYKQELEKSRLEEKVKKYDSQLSSIDEQSSSVMMVSETDGFVKKVNKKLGNPVITITSNVKVIEGQLTEKQFNQAETGMLFTANVAGKKLEGTLGKIHSYPVNDPKIGEENHYHFEATLTEQPEPLAIGSKADLSVVTAEAIGIPTIPEKAIYTIKNPYVYLLNENSRIKKQSVQTGLGFEGIQEMTKGVQIREVLMVSPHKAHQNNAYFVTKMKPNRLTKSSIKDLSKYEKWEFFLTGLIEK